MVCLQTLGLAMVTKNQAWWVFVPIDLVHSELCCLADIKLSQAIYRSWYSPSVWQTMSDCSLINTNRPVQASTLMVLIFSGDRKNVPLYVDNKSVVFFKFVATCPCICLSVCNSSLEINIIGDLIQVSNPFQAFTFFWHPIADLFFVLGCR